MSGNRNPEIADNPVGKDEKKSEIEITVSVLHADAKLPFGNSLDGLRQHKPAEKNSAVGDKGMIVKCAQPVTVQKIPDGSCAAAARAVNPGRAIQQTGKG